MKDIYLFTNSFPYTKTGEIFIEPEIGIVADLDCKIYIVPTNKDSYKRHVPTNIEVLPKIWMCVSMVFSSKFWKMLREARKPKRIAQGTKYLYGALLTRNFLINKTKSPAILYSYWFAYTALGFALAKEDSEDISKCTLVSRGHGYDIFDDSRAVFIPFRKLTLKNLDKVYSVSKVGAEYLGKRFPEYSNKLEVSHLGVFPIEPCGEDKERDYLSFVSCSSVIEVKRVSLIYNSIKHYAETHSDKQIVWTHFGSGNLMPQLEEEVKNHPSNLKVELKGFVSNTDIHKCYSERYFDIFVNLSSS